MLRVQALKVVQALGDVDGDSFNELIIADLEGQIAIAKVIWCGVSVLALVDH